MTTTQCSEGVIERTPQVSEATDLKVVLVIPNTAVQQITAAISDGVPANSSQPGAQPDHPA
eukprot:CAMPEP_0115145782 /NCGR_PEP_ID=MMETSP0227-20121206/62326_1 /TAXON_ID=89957 /ORGANISM="Polarella glacialis, Strain CCMP 1383" /LENGTH=60 /DNA_ID=CAMNT_0002555377 /DNA_START=218 /DNA_END=397 /DNA_ORIENTATION=+